jgi:hypothetical protein
MAAAGLALCKPQDSKIRMTASKGSAGSRKRFLSLKTVECAALSSAASVGLLMPVPISLMAHLNDISAYMQTAWHVHCRNRSVAGDTVGSAQSSLKPFLGGRRIGLAVCPW